MVPWKKARELACTSGTQRFLTTDQMQSIDPNQYINMHDYSTDRRSYWLEYMNHLRRDGRCSRNFPKDRELFDAFYLRLTPQNYERWLDQSSAGLPLLGQGWAPLEHWGVWSDAASSQLHIDLSNDVMSQVKNLVLNFHLYTGPSVSEQRVRVSINGQNLETWTFEGQALKGDMEKSLDTRNFVGLENVTITFKYRNLRSPDHPDEGVDHRQLALALKSIEFVEVPHKDEW